MDSPFRVTLDTVRFSSKPSPDDVSAITRRMQRAGAVEVGGEGFCEAIRQGITFCGGCYEQCDDRWGAFRSMQICAIDVDNSAEIIGADGQPVKDADGRKAKRPLFPGEAGYLDYAGGYERCADLGLHPLAMYQTMSARDGWPKYRIVLDLGEAVCDERAARDVLRSLLGMFPEADRACSNPNRLFYGSNGTVWECWRGERP